MRLARWLTGFVAISVVFLLIPAAAGGAPPQKVVICHDTSDESAPGRGWLRLEVPAPASEGHMAHGDALPGDTVPGSTEGAIFDAECVPQAPEPGDLPPPEETPPDDDPDPTEPPDPGDPPAPPPDDDPDPTEPPDSGDPSELIFAIAYADADPGDGIYDPTTDVLIAKLIDGPGIAANGSPGPGDLIHTARYPMDFGPSAFGDFGVTEHIVTDLKVGLDYVCNVETADGIFIWSSGMGEFDLYQEYDASLTPSVRINDAKIPDSDQITILTSAPSQPLAAVSTLITWDPTDQTFIDVEADCSG